MMTTENLSVSELEATIEKLNDELSDHVVVELNMARDYRRDLSLLAARGDESAKKKLNEVLKQIKDLEDRESLLEEAIDVAGDELLLARQREQKAADEDRMAQLKEVLSQRQGVAEAIDVMLDDLAAGIADWLDLLDQAKLLGWKPARSSKAKTQLSAALWHSLMGQESLKEKRALGILLDAFALGRPSPNAWKPLSSTDHHA